MRVTDYELLDHGIDGSSYFSGCGTAYTDFTHVVTGIGDNPAEAIDDCIAQMASSGHADDTNWDEFNARMLADEGKKKWPTKPRIEEEGNEISEMHYFISIRFNVQ